jgi:hypothetical protein
MVLELFALNMLAIHTALIGMLRFVAVRQHHIVPDLFLLNFGIGTRSGSLTVSSSSDLLFSAFRHDLSFQFPRMLPLKERLVLLFGRAGLLGLVTDLSGIIVLVMVTFLVETAATYRPFALPCLRPCPMHSVVVSRAVHGILHLAGIRDIRPPFQRANQLLMRLLALHNGLR